MPTQVQESSDQKGRGVKDGQDTDRRRNAGPAMDSRLLDHDYSSLIRYQRSATTGMTFLPMVSSGEILSTRGTKPITVSMPMPESLRNCPINSSTFSPLSPTSKAKAQVFSMES